MIKVEPAKRKRICRKCRYSIPKGQACLKIDQAGSVFSICGFCINQAAQDIHKLSHHPNLLDKIKLILVPAK